MNNSSPKIDGEGRATARRQTAHPDKEQVRVVKQLPLYDTAVQPKTLRHQYFFSVSVTLTSFNIPKTVIDGL